MDEAISELSTQCNPKDASRALYLLSAPAKEINMDLVKELGDWLKDLAPNAIIRSGDYQAGKTLGITLILSELSDVKKVREFYNKATGLMPVIKQRQGEARAKPECIDEGGNNIPTVL